MWLEEYDAPTILLFKVSTLNNQHKDIPDQEEQTGVIGAFNFSLWKSDGFYHGNSGCYLFNLTPKFRVFLPNDTKSANSGNYTYLNASPSYNANIGVGMCQCFSLLNLNWINKIVFIYFFFFNEWINQYLFKDLEEHSNVVLDSGLMEEIQVNPMQEQKMTLIKRVLLLILLMVQLE